jgi:hypothetical protein
MDKKFCQPKQCFGSDYLGIFLDPDPLPGLFESGFNLTPDLVVATKMLKN